MTRIPTRRSSPAAPMSGCGSPSSMRELDKIDLARPRRRARRHRRDGRTRSRIGADVEPCARAGARSRRIDPDLGELMRRFGSRAGARRRHGRRQHRQRLADRRHRAGADRARRDARAARRASASRTLPLEDFFIAYRQAGPRSPASSSRRVVVPKLSAGERFRCLQDLEALRPGHLGRDGRVQVRARRDGASRDARIAFGGMAATPKRAQRGGGGARRRVPRRAAHAGGARDALRSRATYQPLDDMRASAAYRATVARNLLLQGA